MRMSLPRLRANLCASLCTQLYTLVCIHVSIHIAIHMRIHVSIHIAIHMRIHAYTHVYAHLYGPIQVSMCMSCSYSCVWPCLRAHFYTQDWLPGTSHTCLHTFLHACPYAGLAARCVLLLVRRRLPHSAHDPFLRQPRHVACGLWIRILATTATLGVTAQRQNVR